ncbi:MAG: hypothetical protein HW405_879, partial [Candidatus Berkelbacteria bacterium]|nr:hypothetical protein [Candidatus Berkelbacteria bacterium]
AQLGKEIMNFASLNNPIDLGGDASALNYFNAINFLNNSNKYSSIIVIVTPQTMTDVKSITQILTKFKNSPKPVIACFLGGTKMNQGIQILRKSSLPHYDDPSEAIKLISRIIQYYYSQKSDHSILEVNIDNNFNNLSDEDILRHYNLPFVKSFRVKNDADIMGHLENMSYPVVYKSQKEKMRGKAGKIGLNIGDHTSLERAVKVIGFPGILQKMVDSPYELIVGAKRDSKFGISLLFGQGGIFTEEFDDICLKLLPLTHADLDEMIETTKVWPLIRNFKVKDILKSLILTISKIMEENLDIQEFEINPLKASYGNIIGVDINIKRAK